jgi:hypothetical protein
MRARPSTVPPTAPSRFGGLAPLILGAMLVLPAAPAAACARCAAQVRQVVWMDHFWQTLAALMATPLLLVLLALAWWALDRAGPTRRRGSTARGEGAATTTRSP